MKCDPYPLMFSHVQTDKNKPIINEPLPDYYNNNNYWNFFHKEESWWDDSNIFEDPFEDVKDEFEFEFYPMKKSNSYEILEVEKDASKEEIKKAFREKVLKVHPDRGGTKEEFVELREAYECLIS